ncbi:gluconate 2-dehydrogenase subunit 3 family protein [Adhaeribacter radiodurans]|uniref:Gluconate 2-dehydrogenase subunit 3 family protein n=1 Tax=Adhaeribacter radiodurans TaxID=2745197 RepID=A0A7L7L737_9BACT|nr:gluconate 2-dehydrogenase subunit 3 family protein [Adhaeribacter radiodurans]QMU28646.1 gluconate 2-dehydrogenase subunit 3 family protein [Adhaeribacter radiodurans]
MDRRESLKVLAIGSLGASALLVGCDKNYGEKGDEKSTSDVKDDAKAEGYGRTPEEKERDAKLMKEQFFTKEEMATIAILCDIIIPKDDHSGSATDAKVPEFIEFMAKDQPSYQTPLRGGLRWLEIKSTKLFEKGFADASKEQQIQLVDMIAYPDKAAKENAQGVAFFNQMRNLTATGFFTSKIGIEDIGYKGNQPNAWDGVPDDVLKQYGLEYDAKTLAQCLKNEDRGKMMTWDS